LIAANLLPTGLSCSPEELERFERIMRRLRLSNGTVRTTMRHRLVEIDQKVGSLLPSVFAPDTALQVEDWAVSSGITAAEWFQSLQPIFPDLTFTASDWILYLIEARREPEGDAFVIDPSGEPIQYIRAPFVVSLTQLQHPLYFINRAIQRRALREWKGGLSARFHVSPEWDAGNGSLQVISNPPFVLRRLPLLYPEVMQMRSERFRIKQHSVFSALSRPVHVIRTMNILNRSYFSVAQLRSAADAVMQSLEPAGVWIVGRTVSDNPPRHDLSVLQKTASGWKPLSRIGKGSEMEAVVFGNTREGSNV
jgi:hypothetical protein